MVELSHVEDLLDLGLDRAEVAVELGVGLEAVLEALGELEPAAEPAPEPELRRPMMGSEAGRMGGRPRKPAPAAAEPSMQTIVKLMSDPSTAHLVAWTGSDDHVVARCDDVQGPGKMAPFKVGGRLISRAGLVRVVAERMCKRRLGVPLLTAKEQQQKAIIGFAVLALEALFVELEEARAA